MHGTLLSQATPLPKQRIEKDTINHTKSNSIIVKTRALARRTQPG